LDTVTSGVFKIMPTTSMRNFNVVFTTTGMSRKSRDPSYWKDVNIKDDAGEYFVLGQNSPDPVKTITSCQTPIADGSSRVSLEVSNMRSRLDSKRKAPLPMSSIQVDQFLFTRVSPSPNSLSTQTRNPMRPQFNESQTPDTVRLSY